MKKDERTLDAGKREAGEPARSERRDERERGRELGAPIEREHETYAGVFEEDEQRTRS